MVRFLVLRERDRYYIQKKLDEWSEENPNVDFDTTECTCTVDENGMWTMVVMYQDI